MSTRKRDSRNWRRFVLALGACSVPSDLVRARTIHEAWKEAHSSQRDWVLIKLGIKHGSSSETCSRCDAPFLKRLPASVLNAFRRYQRTGKAK